MDAAKAQSRVTSWCAPSAPCRSKDKASGWHNCAARLPRPTLITHGEKTHAYHELINEARQQMRAGSPTGELSESVHNAPSADPAAFTAAVFEFLAKRQGL
jgi:pimeloyl-ACP methyl ester carboxylesterase